MCQEDDLLAEIEADPADMTRRLVYADWLDDHGRGDEAEAWRWLAAGAKRPTNRDDSGFDWWFEQEPGLPKHDPCVLYDSQTENFRRWYDTHPTELAALQAAVESYVLIHKGKVTA